MNKLNLKDVEKDKIKITNKQKREIRKLYEEVADEIKDSLGSLEGDKSATGFLQRRRLNDLAKNIDDNLSIVSREINNNIKGNAEKIATEIVKANQEWITKLGLSINGAYGYVPKTVVNDLVSGNIYKGGWSLSKRIWGSKESTMKSIYNIIAKGVSLNKTTYDIAKDLEKYVRPSAKLPWDWGKVYPHSNRVIDYNAQRLARTLVQHAYQQSFIYTTKYNPWIEKYQWEASGARSCPLCMDRDGQLFNKWDVPLDHPNGMCNLIPVISKSNNEIADEIADWYHADEGTYPNIDNYVASLRGRLI